MPKPPSAVRMFTTTIPSESLYAFLVYNPNNDNNHGATGI